MAELSDLQILETMGAVARKACQHVIVFLKKLERYLKVLADIQMAEEVRANSRDAVVLQTRHPGRREELRATVR